MQLISIKKPLLKDRLKFNTLSICPPIKGRPTSVAISIEGQLYYSEAFSQLLKMEKKTAFKKTILEDMQLTCTTKTGFEFSTGLRHAKY